MMVKGDDSGDLEEVERKGNLLMTKYISGTLYEDSNDVFRLESNGNDEFEGGNVLMFLLTFDGGLQVCSKTSLGSITPVSVFINASRFIECPTLTSRYTLLKD